MLQALQSGYVLLSQLCVCNVGWKVDLDIMGQSNSFHKAVSGQYQVACLTLSGVSRLLKT